MLWHHGTPNIGAPPEPHGEWLAAHCPVADLRLYGGEGHISVLNFAPDALAWLRDRAPATSA